MFSGGERARIAKEIRKIALVAAALVAGVTMWGGGGVASASDTFVELRPVSGAPDFPWQANGCVALNAGDGFFNNHTRVFEWGCNGHPDQHWALHFYANAPDGSALYQIINQQSGKCMEVIDDNLNNGTPVDQITCGTGSTDALATQLWESFPLSEMLSPWSALRRGWDFCLDIRGGSNSDGTPIEQWSCNGGDNQKFEYH
jgi:hypothetical protein